MVWILSVALLMICSGCKDHTEFELYFGQPVSVEMAYGFSPLSSGTETRQTAEVIQNNLTNPRLPSFLRVIPFKNDNPQPSEIYWEDPVSKANPPARFYRSRNCNLSVGVNAVRVYGRVAAKQAPTGVNTQVYNGSLIEHFPASIATVNEAKQISFDLEPIYDTSTKGIPADAQTLAGCLNKIAQAGGWNTSTDDNMKELLKIFTNEGYSLPGSAANVRKWINSLIDLINPYLVDNPDASHTVSDEIKNLLNTIKTEANKQLTDRAIADNNYPRDLDLPDGAAVLRWAEVEEEQQGVAVIVHKFVPQVNTTTIDNINSMARFAYPAALYYFIGSDIRTTSQEVDFETLYNDYTVKTWDQVVENINSKSASDRVYSSTKAIVLTNPVQYAVAQLQLNLKASQGSLNDAKGNLIPVGENNFPLTGIIVCDQRPVDYKFETIVGEQGSASDVDVKFIYDSQVETNSCLKTTAEGTWNNVCNTLVLRSHDGEDVNIILEFENNSGQAFNSIDGIVYPETRFYLIGKVEPGRYETPGSTVPDDNRKRVFTRDYITKVNMTVSSLAKAYNVPPNLLSNNLEIGVETTPDWVAATPTGFRLE